MVVSYNGVHTSSLYFVFLNSMLKPKHISVYTSPADVRVEYIVTTAMLL